MIHLLCHSGHPVHVSKAQVRATCFKCSPPVTFKVVPKRPVDKGESKQ